MEVIDKSALVAEIEKRINKEIQSCATDLGYSQGYIDSMRNVLSLIDTLEVKEINIDELLSDLDKDIKEFIATEEFERDSAVYGHFWVIAKHAFLFGLRIKLCLENLEAI